MECILLLQIHLDEELVELELEICLDHACWMVTWDQAREEGWETFSVPLQLDFPVSTEHFSSLQVLLTLPTPLSLCWYLTASYNVYWIAWFWNWCFSVLVVINWSAKKLDNTISSTCRNGLNQIVLNTF